MKIEERFYFDVTSNAYIKSQNDNYPNSFQAIHILPCTFTNESTPQALDVEFGHENQVHLYAWKGHLAVDRNLTVKKIQRQRGRLHSRFVVEPDIRFLQLLVFRRLLEGQSAGQHDISAGVAQVRRIVFVVEENQIPIQFWAFEGGQC